MKRLALILVTCVGLALAAGAARGDSPYRMAGHHEASIELVSHGHGVHHGHANWPHGRHGNFHGWNAYYHPRPLVYPRPYVYRAPVYPYPVYPYGYSGITVYGPRVGVSIGF